MRPSLPLSFKALAVLLAALSISPGGAVACASAIDAPIDEIDTSASAPSKKAPPPYVRSATLTNPAYSLLSERANSIALKNHDNGWAYIISGSIILGVTLPAYYVTQDEFAKAVYSMGQTIGVAGISYGSYLALLDNDFVRFKRGIDSVPGLGMTQKEYLARQFLLENAGRARSIRKILVISTALSAGLSFSSGINYSNSDLKTLFYFLGSINLLAAMNFLLVPSEDEKIYRKLSEPEAQSHVEIAPILGPVAGIRVSF